MVRLIAVPYLSVVSLLLAVAAPAAGQARSASPREAPAAAPISREAFASLRWLEGRWVGSGGGYAAFYEAYAFLNDSTIEQREHPDSTFGEPRRRATIEWRNGAVLKRTGERVESRLVRVAGDTARFEMGAGPRGFTWYRVSADEWAAVLDGRTEPVVYRMRRFAGGRSR